MTHYELAEKVNDLIAEAQAELAVYHYGTAALYMHKASELLATMQRREFNQAIAVYAKREGLPYDH